MAAKQTKKAKMREEALVYLKEVINANRAIKDWMFRNTYYAVLGQFGVFVLFKDMKDILGWVLGLILMTMLWVLAFYILRSNRLSIEQLRDRERSLIQNTPLPWIEKNWAGSSAKKGPDNRYFRIYFGIILVTGLVLILAMTRGNEPVKEVFCKMLCSNQVAAPNIVKPK